MFFKVFVLVIFIVVDNVVAGRHNNYLPNNQHGHHTNQNVGTNQTPQIIIHLHFGPAGGNVHHAHHASTGNGYMISKAIEVPISIGRSGPSANIGNNRLPQSHPYSYTKPTRKVVPVTAPPPAVAFGAPVKPGKTDEINPRTIAGTFG